MKTFIAAALLVVSLSASAENEVILVSDIDDTIKNSHVLDPDSTIANAFLPNNTFMGMPQLYQSLLDDKKVDEVVYLSNAPKFLMYPFHRHFLKREGFPFGRLVLNANFSKIHKLKSLRRIIEIDKPKELILIGDNGEHDTEVYATIAKEYPEQKITTFIHQVYSQIGFHNNFGKLLEENQIGYATSLDLSLHLMEKNYLMEESYATILNEILPLAVKESNYKERGRPIMFPAWLDCRDFSAIEIPVKKEVNAELVFAFNKKVSDRCSVEPYEN